MLVSLTWFNRFLTHVPILHSFINIDRSVKIDLLSELITKSLSLLVRWHFAYRNHLGFKLCNAQRLFFFYYLGLALLIILK